MSAIEVNCLHFGRYNKDISGSVPIIEELLIATLQDMPDKVREQRHSDPMRIR